MIVIVVPAIIVVIVWMPVSCTPIKSTVVLCSCRNRECKCHCQREADDPSLYLIHSFPLSSSIQLDAPNSTGDTQADLICPDGVLNSWKSFLYLPFMPKPPFWSRVPLMDHLGFSLYST